MGVTVNSAVCKKRPGIDVPFAVLALPTVVRTSIQFIAVAHPMEVALGEVIQSNEVVVTWEVSRKQTHLAPFATGQFSPGTPCTERIPTSRSRLKRYSATSIGSRSSLVAMSVAIMGSVFESTCDVGEGLIS